MSAVTKNIMNVAILERAGCVMALASENPSLRLYKISHYATLRIELYWRHGKMDDLVEVLNKGSQVVANTPEDNPDFTRLSAERVR